MSKFDALQYRNGECSHDEYYLQFVTDRTIEIVKQYIGEKCIKASTNLHFNDIPLREWDRLVPMIKSSIDSSLWKELNSAGYAPCCKGKFMWSLSDGVSIAKQAARIIKDKIGV